MPVPNDWAQEMSLVYPASHTHSTTPATQIAMAPG
jgi:hypothetical protein